MIFFHDKHWFQSHLPTISESDEESEADDAEPRPSSPTPSQTTITSAPASSTQRKTEYEFLLFNYLLRFAHREGRIGDFARAGLLFLMDVAMSAGEPTAHKLVDDAIRSDAETTLANSSDPVSDAALALAEYVLDGDFSDVLGAGLGAVYSLLPSKLDTRPEFNVSEQMVDNGVILGVGIYDSTERQRIELEREHNYALGLESTSSLEFRARLDHFLKLLEFLQDVLRRNTASDTHSSLAPSALVGNAIVQSILDSVRSVFLENILYTSILECSDADGSAVAVMSYIDIMIRTLGNSQLSDLLVGFLMSEDDHDPRRPHPKVLALDRNRKERERISKVRRKSSAMALLEMEAPDSRKQTEYYTSLGRFTLKDLISSNIRSSYQASATAAFRLLQTLLTFHPVLCIDKLLIALRDPEATSFPQPARLLSTDDAIRPASPATDDEVFIYPGDVIKSSIPQLYPIFKEPSTTYFMHELEMDMYSGLISRISPSQNHSFFSTGYENYLNDVTALIRSHPSFYRDAFTERPSSRFTLHHRLCYNDPLILLLLNSLREFFSHSPEYNVALTGVFASLAMDPYRTLSGWLTFDAPISQGPIHRVDVDNVTMDEDDRSVDLELLDHATSANDPGLLAMPLSEALRPIIYSICLGLVNQLDKYRAQIKDFDSYVQVRRQGLLFSESLSDALNLTIEEKEITRSSVDSITTQPISPARPKQKQKSSSFVSFLTPKKKGASVSTHSESGTPSRKKVIPASPFSQHYQETRSMDIVSSAVPLPSAGPWSPSKKQVWSTPEDVFTSSAQWGESNDAGGEAGGANTVVKITLSHLLDNVVILEESLKELISIIHARRSLGIDSVRYI